MQHARAEGTMPLSNIKDLGGVRLSYMLRNVIFDDILVVSLGSISQYHHTRRQCSPVVRILALRFRGGEGGQSLFILHLAGLTVQQTDY